MKKREADFGILFRHWIKANPQPSSAYELKATKSNAIAFDSVVPHQILALQAAKTKYGILYKAPDDSRGIKPFDYFYLRDAFAFIVIKYPSMFCFIEVDTFVEERGLSFRKSLTSERARQIAVRVVDLGVPASTGSVPSIRPLMT